MANKFKKGDKIKVITGKDKGKEEKIIKVFPKAKKILVEKINVAKRHTKPNQSYKGGIVERVIPLDMGKVMLVCPACSKPTRVGFKTLKDQEKVRFCKKCKENIDK